MKRLVLPVVLVALALAGCLPTSPPPPPPPPRDVLLLGDSLMVATAAQLPAAATAAGFHATFNAKAFYGLGLLDPINGQDPQDALLQDVRDDPTATDVVIEFLGNCLAACQANYVPGSPEFYAAWSDAATGLISAIHSEFPALRVFWTISPRIGGSLPAAGLSPSTEATLSSYDRTTFGAKVDWWTPLNDAQGDYQRSNLRTADDIHLTDVGARVLADATVTALKAAP